MIEKQDECYISVLKIKPLKQTRLVSLRKFSSVGATI